MDNTKSISIIIDIEGKLATMKAYLTQVIGGYPNNYSELTFQREMLIIQDMLIDLEQTYPGLASN